MRKILQFIYLASFSNLFSVPLFLRLTSPLVFCDPRHTSLSELSLSFLRCLLSWISRSHLKCACASHSLYLLQFLFQWRNFMYDFCFLKKHVFCFCIVYQICPLITVFLIFLGGGGGQGGGGFCHYLNYLIILKSYYFSCFVAFIFILNSLKI